MDMINNPFDGFDGDRIENLDSKEFLKMLLDFEAQEEQNCLSVFLKSRNGNDKFHMDCGGPMSRTYSCVECHICKEGKYNRSEFIRYVYGERLSKRGNIIK